MAQSKPTGLPVYNVKKIQHEMNKLDTDDYYDAITAAFAAARDAWGGIIHFPVGTYNVGSPLLIPRCYINQNDPSDQNNGTPIPIRLTGVGPAGSNYRMGSTINGTYIGTEPLLKFDNSTAAHSYFFMMDGIMLKRGDVDGSDGPLLHHKQEQVQASDGGPRLVQSIISNCRFSSGKSTVAGDTADLILIEGGYNSIIDNIMVSGGGTCLHLRNSSRMIIRNLTTWNKNDSNNVIIIEGGGDTTIENVFLSGGTGVGVQLIGGTANTMIYRLASEGYKETTLLDIADASAVVIREPSIGSPDSDGLQHIGIQIGSDSRFITVENGIIGAFRNIQDPANSDSRAIRVGIGAQHVRVSGLAFVGGVYSAGNSDVEIEQGVNDVHISVYEKLSGDLPYVFGFAGGIGDTAGMNSGILHFGADGGGRSGNNLIIVADGHDILAIEKGYDGQTVTLIFLAAGAHLHYASAPNEATDFPWSPMLLKEANDWMNIPPNSTIKLIFYAESWYEVCRTSGGYI